MHTLAALCAIAFFGQALTVSDHPDWLTLASWIMLVCALLVGLAYDARMLRRYLTARGLPPFDKVA